MKKLTSYSLWRTCTYNSQKGQSRLATSGIYCLATLACFQVKHQTGWHSDQHKDAYNFVCLSCLNLSLLNRVKPPVCCPHCVDETGKCGYTNVGYQAPVALAVFIFHLNLENSNLLRKWIEQTIFVLWPRDLLCGANQIQETEISW